MTSHGSPPPPAEPPGSLAAGAGAARAEWRPSAGDSNAEPGRADDWLVEIFGLHSRRVHAYARRRLDSAEDAEDVVVEVFATAWRRRDDVPGEALPWLYATAGNVISHVLRSDARRTRLGTRLATVSSLHAPVADPASAVVDAVAARGVVGAALEDLAEADAELLRLWAWEQLEPNEIAAVLGCSAGTARTRLHRARSRLRTALAHRGVGDAELGPADAGLDDGPGPELGAPTPAGDAARGRHGPTSPTTPTPRPTGSADEEASS